MADGSCRLDQADCATAVTVPLPGGIDLEHPYDVSPDPEFDDFARLAATICGTPMGAVTMFSEGKQWIKGRNGIERLVMPADQSFCIHALGGTEILEVCDATRDERFATNPLVSGPRNFRFYAGMPMIVDGRAIGAVCVLDTIARPEGLTAEQRRSLAMLAVQAGLQLQVRRALAERERTALELRAAIDQLRWAATHDHLTGLGNRALLREALNNLSRSGAGPFAILAIDVDHFKQINDSFGHETGDLLLKEIGTRLAESVREGDVVARLGGDEFAIVLCDLADEERTAARARQLLEAMRRPFIAGGRTLEPRITIGGANWPLHTRSVHELVCFADAALYEGKARGRGVFIPFEEGLLAEQSRRRSAIARARSALAADQIVPFYQPKVDLADGTILGFEALLRVIVPGEAPALPGVLAAAFDEAEIAQQIGACLLRQILRDMRGWLDQGLSFGRIAINVSATEIGDPDYPARLFAALAEYDVPADLIEIEILETVLLDRRSTTVLAIVRELAGAGVRIAFDDFGTGYAALAHLPAFPVSTIKIDQTFVRNLDLRANQAIVRALIALARELGLEAVAEGVETALQAADLIAMGCVAGQGFFYSHAIPAAAVTQALVQRGLPRRRRSAMVLADRLSLARAA